MRSEVRRLRAKLQAYYVGLGEHDELRIDIPKGGYAPKVSFLDAPKITPISNAAARPYIYWLVVLMALSVQSVSSFNTGRLCRQMSAFIRSYHLPPTWVRNSVPSISPAGDRIAYVAHVDGHGTRIFIKGIDSREPTAFTAPDGVYLFPSWAPDGHALAYLRVEADHVSVLTRTIDGTAERVVTTIAKEIGRWSDQPMQLVGNPGPVWAKEGTRLVHRRSHTDAHWTQSGRQRRHTSSVDCRSQAKAEIFVHESRPTVHRSHSSRYYSHGTADIYLVPLSGGTVHQVTNEAHAIQGIAWDFDGKSLIASSNRDGSYALWRFPLVRVSECHPYQCGGPHRASRLYQQREPSPTLNPAKTGISGVALYPQVPWGNPDYSSPPPGETTILATHQTENASPSSPTARVPCRYGWSMQPAQRPCKPQVLAAPGMGGLTWSPDSRTLAFDARPQGHAAIFLLDVLSGKVQTLFDNNFEERMPSFSGDGRALYFNSTRSGDVDIWPI